MDESFGTDHRSVRLIFEADRRAADLLSSVYQRLLASSDAVVPRRDGVQDGETRDVQQPLWEEVRS